MPIIETQRDLMQELAKGEAIVRLGISKRDSLTVCPIVSPFG